MELTKELVQKEKEKVSSTEERTRNVMYYKPDVDIFETENEIVIEADVPGVDTKSIDIDLNNDILTIEAKINPDAYEGLTPLYSEYRVGHYYRKFALDTTISQSDIKAKMQNGVLRIALPKSEKAKPRKVSIQSGE